MWIWLEGTALAQWVGLSLWAYPALLALHIVGLAIVVGIFAMRDLSLLGLVSGLLPADFVLPVRLAFGGFVLNAVSGVLLFTSQASIFAASTVFQIKLTCIALGMVLAWQLQRRLPAATGAAAAATPSLRLLAGASLLCWLGAITAGRLIAYLG